MSTEHWWNDNDGGKPKKSEKNLCQCHFNTINPTTNDVGLNRVLHGERPETNRQSHGMNSTITIFKLQESRSYTSGEIEKANTGNILIRFMSNAGHSLCLFQNKILIRLITKLCIINNHV
jgi:hypothetical protein